MSLDNDIHLSDNELKSDEFHFDPTKTFRNQFNNPWTIQLDDRLRAMWLSGLRLNDIGATIAKDIGYTISGTAISKRAERLRLPLARQL